MNDDKIRWYLTVAVVGFFLMTVFLAFVAGVIGYMDTDTTKEFIKSIFSVFSGIIGVIIGYYFSKGHS